MKTAKIKAKGMHCKSCETLIKMALEEVDGINKADASFESGIVEVKFDDAKISEKDIVELIAIEGYEIE